MSLVGVTKIQLINSVTGEVEKEVISENMVTNAVRNILNPHTGLMLGNASSTNFCNFFKVLGSISKTLFGGVMVFSNHLSEDTDYIIPTPEDRASIIGYGGQCPSLAGNKYRGTYNSAESVYTENSITHVWDFTGEQSNGLISAIALTSSWGGEGGWDTNAVDLAKFLIPIIQTNKMNTLLTADIASRFIDSAPLFTYLAGTNTFFNIRSIVTDNYFMMTCSVATDSYEFRAYVRELSSVAKLSNPMENLLNAGSLPTNFVSYTASKTGLGYSYRAYGENRAIYYTTAVTLNGSVYTSVLSILEVTLVNGVPTFNEFTYTLVGVRMQIGYPATRNYFYVDADYLYMFTADTRLLKISRSDVSQVTSIPVPAEITDYDSACISKYRGSLLVSKFASDTTTRFASILNANGVSWSKVAYAESASTTTRYGALEVTHTSIAKEPYCLVRRLPRDTQKEDTGFYTCIVSPYLATINNLASPVNKTSAQTMKLSYTLTNS